MSTRESLCAVALVCAMALPTTAHAQDGEGAVKAFQAASDETLQDQRHRHLWIAYAALWAIALVSCGARARVRPRPRAP